MFLSRNLTKNCVKFIRKSIYIKSENNNIPEVFIILSIISIKNEKLLNSNNIRNKPKFIRLLQEIVIFRLVVHLQNMIRLNLLFYYTILSIQIFDTGCYQSLHTVTSDRTLMDLNQLPKCSGFILYPLSFPLYSPFKQRK